VRFLDFVEQDHAVRATPHAFGKLTAFVVADIAGRRADEPRHCMTLHVFGHVDADHRLFIAKYGFGQRFREFRLADARRSEKQKGSDRLVCLTEPRARHTHRIAHGDDGIVLPYDSFTQRLFHPEQLLALFLRQIGHGNAREARDDLRDRFDGHLQRLGAGFALPRLGLLIERLLFIVDAILEAFRLVEAFARRRVILLTPELRNLGF